MKIVLLFGPQAVGKMTIGTQLSERSNLPLLYNHMTLDVVWPIIGWNKDTFKISDQMRLSIFEHIAKNNTHPGLIFTFVWAFNLESDWNYIKEIKQLFNQPNHELYFVELKADLTERLRRNKTEFRLEKKPSKRDVEYSEIELLRAMEKHRLNSFENEIEEKIEIENYFCLDVTNISADKAAEIIQEWIQSN